MEKNFLKFNVVIQMNKERPKEAPTYQTPRSNHRATTESALLVTSLKWPPLLATFQSPMQGLGRGASQPAPSLRF